MIHAIDLSYSSGTPTRKLSLSLFNFLKKKPSAVLRATAEREVLEAREACRRVFDKNVSALLRDTEGLQDLFFAPRYDYTGFNDLFLRGVLDAFMEVQPTLPTEPAERALLHMAAYLAEREEITLAEGITRAKATEQRYNANQPIFDAFIEAGRLAYKEDSDHRLADISRRIRNKMILDDRL